MLTISYINGCAGGTRIKFRGNDVWGRFHCCSHAVQRYSSYLDILNQEIILCNIRLRDQLGNPGNARET